LFGTALDFPPGLFSGGEKSTYITSSAWRVQYHIENREAARGYWETIPFIACVTLCLPWISAVE